MTGYIRIERGCAGHYRQNDHPAHDWDATGHWWCPGWPRQLRLATPDPNAPPCPATWTGPTGVVWDCTAPEHPSDPTLGYAGSGHVWAARPRATVTP